VRLCHCKSVRATSDLFALDNLRESYEAVDEISAGTERRAGPSATADARLFTCAQEDDLYESSDMVPPITVQRQRRPLPGQVSMPESALPPVVHPRKQSCPDLATSRPRAPKLLPDQPAESACKPPTDTARRANAPTPPVADKKSRPPP